MKILSKQKIITIYREVNPYSTTDSTIAEAASQYCEAEYYVTAVSTTSFIKETPHSGPKQILAITMVLSKD